MKNKKLGLLYRDGEIIIKQGSIGNCLYVIQEGKVEIINEEKNYGPREPIITLLPEQYIKCKVCGHKYYLDGSNEYGFPIYTGFYLPGRNG